MACLPSINLTNSHHTKTDKDDIFFFQMSSFVQVVFMQKQRTISPILLNKKATIQHKSDQFA